MESPLSETNIPKQTIQIDRSEKNNKIKQEFFTMQNTINNSLSKEIAAVMEKCNKIEAKMKKQKAKMKEMRRVQPEPIEEYGDTSYRMSNQDWTEYDEEDEQNEQIQEEYYNEPNYYSRFNARRRIDLRNFS